MSSSGPSVPSLCETRANLTQRPQRSRRTHRPPPFPLRSLRPLRETVSSSGLAIALPKSMRIGKMLGGAVAAAGALGAYAFLVEPRWLQVTRTRIHGRRLHPALEGFTVGLLTDLHAGEGTPLSLIRRACRLAMAEQPDLIAVTGDLVADDAP